MSIALSKEKLIEITGGQSVPRPGGYSKIVFHGVEYSSREITGGELFVALPGERSHGHKFIGDAFSRGAALLLVEDPALLEGFPEPERMVVVPDTLKAFQQLASFWRHELALPVLAITGSVGKTTTKEIAASILLQSGPGTYALKSHNNHVGVPYTICRMKPGQRWAVLEMGMNHPGELKALSDLAGPDMAAITRIAPAHIMSFDSLDAIAEAKLEILSGLKATAPLILNADDEVLVRASRRLRARDTRPLLFFGEGPDPEGRNCAAAVSNIQAHGLDCITFTLALEGLGSREVRMGVLGRQTAVNAACAALAARTLCPGLTLDEICQGLEKFRAPLMRLNLKELTEERRLIDDSYNANPTSMGAFIQFAADLKAGAPRGVGLIVGDMYELGKFAPQYHQEVGDLLARTAPGFIVAVGEFAPLLLGPAQAAGVRTFAAGSPEEAAEIALGQPFEILMIKASRGVGLDRAANLILQKAGAPVP